MRTKSILNKLAKELEAKKSDRKKTSLFLSEKVFKEFKQIAEGNDMSPSVLIEHLMREFIEGEKKKGE